MRDHFKKDDQNNVEQTSMIQNDMQVYIFNAKFDYDFAINYYDEF